MTQYYIGTTSEPGTLNSLSKVSDLYFDPAFPERKWDQERFLRFFTRDPRFLNTLRISIRAYDFDGDSANSNLRTLTAQEKVMVEGLIKNAPYPSSDEVRARIHEIRDEENLDELQGRFWR